MFLAVGVGAAVYLGATRASLLTALHERMARTLGQVVGVSTQPLWNLDREFLEPYLDEAMKDPDIWAVRVVSTVPTRLTSTSEPGFSGPSFLRSPRARLEYRPQ